MVSVILPTRGRVEKLKESLESLYSNGEDFELLVGADNDDMDTVNFLIKNYPDTKILLIKRLGYLGLHYFVNNLSKIASGEWLFLWNDDCIMKTKDWDKIINKQTGFKVFCPRSNQFDYRPTESNLFPIIPRRWIEILGHFSLSPQNDSYVQHVALDAGIQQDIPIEIEHRHFTITGEKDKTAKEVVYEENFPDKYIKQIYNDSRKIQQCLK